MSKSSSARRFVSSFCQRSSCAVLENNDMAAPLPAVFLSYRRRVSAFIARSVLQDLTQHGYDVFMDVKNMGSGDFETIILESGEF